MRVMCIKKCKDYSGDKPYWYSPEVGDELDVIDVKIQYGQLWYDLAGYSEFLYDADYFEVLTPDAEPETITEKETLLITSK